MIDPVDKKVEGCQLVLRATTELEFCQLLRVIWLRSLLTLGQAKCKTRISRSQIYNLTRMGRSRLPRFRDQVEVLATACGLSADEVVIVLTLWDRLHRSPAS